MPKTKINSFRSFKQIGILLFAFLGLKETHLLTTSFPCPKNTYGSLGGHKYVGIFMRKMTEENPRLTTSCKYSD